MQVATVEPGNPAQAQAIARQAAAVLDNGGLVVFPTETVYGVAASARSAQAIAALRDLKSDGDPQFTVHVPGPGAAQLYIDTTSPALRRLVDKVLPGPVAIVVDAPDELIDRRLEALGLARSDRDRVYHRNTVALRCPDHPLTRQMLAAAAAPVVAGSANRAGSAHPREAADAVAAIGDRVDLVVDGGLCRYAKPSTIVRVRGQGLMRSIVVERAGVYDERFIRKLLRWTMLLVCSGNTCRSPMAEAIGLQLVADLRGVALDDLQTSGFRVHSAGLYAVPGSPASVEAVEALAAQGIDLSHHRARALRPELVQESDVIYCMTEAHRRAVIELVPFAADRTCRLDPAGDIDDPIGSGAVTYRRIAQIIRSRLDERLKEQQP